MQKIMVTGLAAGFFLVATAGLSAASPIQWGSNGNWYELVRTTSNDTGWTWSEANELAAHSIYNGMAGHLATITSSEENQFIFNDLSIADGAVWLGAFQDEVVNQNPEEDWHWVTGEVWDYTNWADDEPNDWNGTIENALAFAFFEGIGTWNDASMTHSGYDLGMGGGYVVEYEGAMPVPEPATMFLFGAGLAGLAGFRSRRKKM